MESFFKLRADKQKHIIDAALNVFARNGYKKASIGDIADEASISKGMVSYYFGSKKNLYLYLTEFCGNMLVDEMESRFDNKVTDFFEKIMLATDIKLSLMKKHRSCVHFFASACNETDAEVQTNIRELLSGELGLRMQKLATPTDISKLKSGIDHSLLELFFIWTAEGLLKEIQNDNNAESIENAKNTFGTCLELFRMYMYTDIH